MSLNKPVLTSQEVDRIIVALEPLAIYPSELVRLKAKETVKHLQELSLMLFKESVDLYMRENWK